MAVQQFEIKCGGRDSARREILEPTVVAMVSMIKWPDSGNLSIDVQCPHIGGKDNKRCLASGRKAKARCPYSVDLPSELDRRCRKRST